MDMNSSGKFYLEFQNNWFSTHEIHQGPPLVFQRTLEVKYVTCIGSI